MKPQTILGIDAAWTASEGSGVALLSATEKIAGAQPTVIHRQYTRNRGGLSTGFTIALLKKAPLILMGLVTVVALGIAACESSSETTATITTQREGPQTTAGPAATTATTEALSRTVASCVFRVQLVGNITARVPRDVAHLLEALTGAGDEEMRE